MKLTLRELSFHDFSFWFTLRLAPPFPKHRILTDQKAGFANTDVVSSLERLCSECLETQHNTSGVRGDRHSKSGLKVARPPKVDSCNHICRIALNPTSLSKALFAAAVVRTDEPDTVGILLQAGMDANITMESRRVCVAWRPLGSLNN